MGGSDSKTGDRGQSPRNSGRARMGRVRPIHTIAIEELHGEVARRQRRIPVLQQRREKILTKLQTLDSQIRDLGGTIDGNGTLGGRRRRAVNATPLPEALKAVLKGKTLSVTEAAEAVQAAGYKTHSSNFKIMVNMVLTKYPKMFKRVARGQYTTRE